jgi:hypothetical protein
MKERGITFVFGFGKPHFWSEKYYQNRYRVFRRPDHQTQNNKQKSIRIQYFYGPSKPWKLKSNHTNCLLNVLSLIYPPTGSAQWYKNPFTAIVPFSLPVPHRLSSFSLVTFLQHNLLFSKVTGLITLPANQPQNKRSINGGTRALVVPEVLQKRISANLFKQLHPWALRRNWKRDTGNWKR